jgi:hypothetical protein
MVADSSPVVRPPRGHPSQLYVAKDYVFGIALMIWRGALFIVVKKFYFECNTTKKIFVFFRNKNKNDALLHTKATGPRFVPCPQHRHWRHQGQRHHQEKGRSYGTPLECREPWMETVSFSVRLMMMTGHGL